MQTLEPILPHFRLFCAKHKRVGLSSGPKSFLNSHVVCPVQTIINVATILPGDSLFGTRCHHHRGEQEGLNDPESEPKLMVWNVVQDFQCAIFYTFKCYIWIIK